MCESRSEAVPAAYSLHDPPSVPAAGRAGSPLPLPLLPLSPLLWMCGCNYSTDEDPVSPGSCSNYRSVTAQESWSSGHWGLGVEARRVRRGKGSSLLRDLHPLLQKGFPLALKHPSVHTPFALSPRVHSGTSPASEPWGPVLRPHAGGCSSILSPSPSLQQHTPLAASQEGRGPRQLLAAPSKIQPVLLLRRGLPAALAELQLSKTGSSTTTGTCRS